MKQPQIQSIALGLALLTSPLGHADGLKVSWQDRMLSIQGEFPGGEIPIHYLEAYCRAGSTDRDWGETVIPHKAVLVEASEDGKRILLQDTLEDGVVVDHHITANSDSVDFRIIAHNPTDERSAADWAQPCIRVDRFTGCRRDDARDRIPAYARKCFLYLDGKPTFLPTTPWVDEARYVYGQVFVPHGVNRNDVNPRPLSPLVPSNGLCGCVSADEQMLFAVAWEPYQEIFLGVISCIHSDFRVGGIEPGQTKQIRGKVYIVANDHSALLKRYERDFPEQAAASAIAKTVAELPELKRSMPPGDFLRDARPYVARAGRNSDGSELVLDNGLIRRTWRLAPNGACVGFDNLMNGEAMLRSVRPEARVTIDGVRYDVGGLVGQPNHAYLAPIWLNAMRADAAAPAARRGRNRRAGRKVRLETRPSPCAVRKTGRLKVSLFA